MITDFSVSRDYPVCALAIITRYPDKGWDHFWFWTSVKSCWHWDTVMSRWHRAHHTGFDMQKPHCLNGYQVCQTLIPWASTFRVPCWRCRSHKTEGHQQLRS